MAGEIVLNVFLLLLGFVLLVKGADFFVDGAAGIAKKLKISTFIIGVTVVALGTSAPELAVTVTDALGGSGELHNLTRDYTEIELAILENVLGKVVVKLQDAWRNSIDCTARLTSVETNARLLQVIAPEEIIVIVMLNVKIGDMTAPMTICIPAESLEEVIDKFSVRYTRTNNRRLDPDHERIKKEILLQGVCNTDMKIQATFDRLELKLWEIMQLQPMDVIPLNKRIDDDVDITLGGVPWFTAKLGELDDKKAIKLNRCINPVEEPALPGEDPEEDGEDSWLVGSEMRETRK